MTTYVVRDDRDNAALVLDADRAERLSRAGLRVTAHTEGGR
jgi:hypothetical protein